MKWRTARFSAASAELDSVSPMCGPTKARFPGEQAEGGLEHAAQGQDRLRSEKKGRATGSGTKPRLRRKK